MSGCALLFLALCILFSPFVADDAYIVGRYAMNAADGLGLVYNVGERVSALTSPLHALVETLLATTGMDPVLGYRLAAPLLLLFAWWVAVCQVRLEGRTLLLFTVLSLGSPFLVLWTVGGLETPLLAALAVLFTVRLVTMSRQAAPQAADFLWLGVTAGLMFVTRYDTVLVTVPPLLAVVSLYWRRADMWAGAAVCLLVASSWLVFAALYYGDIFPTSFYLKFALAGRAAIDSLSATLNFILLSGFVLAIALVRLPAMEEHSPLGRALLRGGAISAVLFFVYASQAAGQHMMFGYRLFMPYLMAAALLVALAVPASRGHWLVPTLAGWQATMVAVVTFSGVNPAPLTRMPGLQEAYAEYEFVTPRAYGAFMDMLTQDALDVAAHWKATGRQEQPRIYLRTGGTGRWLRDFYVYESLVTYRHGCGVQMDRGIMAAHYVQQLGLSVTGTDVEEVARSRSDIEQQDALLSVTTLDWNRKEHLTGYLYGSAPAAFELGGKIDSGCGSFRVAADASE